MGSMYTSKNIIERLELEQQELPILAQTTGERAELLLRNILNAGSTHIRTHVNIDPYIGLKNLESVRQTLENMKDAFTYEIVAFPQHGLLRTEAHSLMREAMKMGATLVGGVIQLL